jgi:hypothetical protein
MMEEPTANDIKKQALHELHEEYVRSKVDELKAKLSRPRTIWRRLFPYKITITRR